MLFLALIHTIAYVPRLPDNANCRTRPKIVITRDISLLGRTICGICLARHNDCTHCIGDTARRETGAQPEYVNNLSSSTSVGTKIDVVLQSFFITPNIIGLDLTISCLLLPAYQKDASVNTNLIFLDKGNWKTAKHAASDSPADRTFLPVV